MTAARTFSTALLLTGALGLGACAVGPDYRPPAVPVVEKRPFREAASTETVSAAPASSTWWELYSDPALSRLIDDAFRYNTDIRAAAANLRLARAQLSEARAGRLPATDLSASYSRERVGADQLGPAGIGGAETPGRDHSDFDFFQAGFDASYEVDVFGRVSRSIEAARADAQASEASLDGIRISIAAQVAQSYADACGAAMQADVARETASLETETRDLTQRLLDAGRGTQRDVDQANVLVEQANAQVPGFEGERRAQLYALATLTGRPPADIDAAAAACRVVPKVKTQIPVGDGAALLARRPDVRAAERRLAADTARIGVATASLFPSVTLLGSVSLGAPKIGNIGKPASFGYSFGPLISWTFPNFAVARAKIRQARAGSDASLAEFQGTILTALRETEQALARYAAAIEQNAALARAASSAENAADQTKQRFDSGRDNFLDLLVAEQNRAAARQALAQSDTNVANLQVSLFKALGGGWEKAPPTLDTLPPAIGAGRVTGAPDGM
ncbi:efflux transporter outer membrane subunit [Sphingomonas sp. PR090111-T3T-6A]|uniref:efflux transporter outer membrane subunit n=1 Tax=Sphingomonas sp. PR090111-T3T-6A TaxID=685778 RepID=UPI00037764D7|nr:TolC family protein [Sphingomonas sp. PR090111-T3T-6A]